MTAVITVLTLLFLTSLFEDLPEATLAAVVIAAVIELVDIEALVRLYRIYTGRLGRIYGIAARPDFLAAMAALLGVLIFDTLPGLFIGIVASVLLLLCRASRPNVAELGRVPGTAEQYGDRQRHPENLPPPGLVVLRVESGLFFANADEVRRSVITAAERDGIHGVVLDAETIGAVDITAVTMLSDLAGELHGRIVASPSRMASGRCATCSARASPKGPPHSSCTPRWPRQSPRSQADGSGATGGAPAHRPGLRRLSPARRRRPHRRAARPGPWRRSPAR